MSISRSLVVFTLSVLFVPLVSVQSQAQHYVAAGAATVGEGNSGLYLSAGSEKVSSRGVSIGVNGGLLLGRRGVRVGDTNRDDFRVYVVSLITGIHALSDDRLGFEPFASGGISLAVASDEGQCCGPGFLWNIGAGANYWLNRRLGIRIDGKMLRPFGGDGGMLTTGIGMTFR